MKSIDLGRMIDSKTPGEKFWAIVLLTSVKDGARRVSFDPERGEERLCYEVDSLEYSLLPPPEELDQEIAQTMSSWLQPRRRLLESRRKPPTTEALLCLTVDGADVAVARGNVLANRVSIELLIRSTTVPRVKTLLATRVKASESQTATSVEE